jgi:hypothetical protein
MAQASYSLFAPWLSYFNLQAGLNLAFAMQAVGNESD